MVQLRDVSQSWLVELIFRILVILSLVAGSYVWYRQEKFINCIAEYNDVSNRRLSIVSKFSEAESKARRENDDVTRRVYTDPLVGKPRETLTPAELEHLQELLRIYRKSLDDLSRKQQEADKARQDNPIPEPPKVRCS